MPEIASPYVRLSWDDPGDTGITHYRILRRDVDTHKKGQFIVIDGNTGSSQTQYLDRSVENDKRYVYRIVGVNEHGESGQSRSAKADTYLVAIAPFPGSDDTSPRDLPPPARLGECLRLCAGRFCAMLRKHAHHSRMTCASSSMTSRSGSRRRWACRGRRLPAAWGPATTPYGVGGRPGCGPTNIT